MKPVDHFGLTGMSLAGKFRIDAVVAEGGFGVVYAGRHLDLDLPVAIKVLRTPADLAPEAQHRFVENFVLEAKTSARLRHANIVQVLDVGVAETMVGDAAFMVLEWLDGETLGAWLQKRRGQGGRTAAEALALLRPAFEALAFAHEEGIAHRDIKPANIMLTPTRRGTSLRVLDFGIAKSMGEGEEAGTGKTRTAGAMSAYSPRYAAPEQIGRARTGPWTDVHALGLLMTEVILDRRPYRSEELTDVIQEALSPERPTPGKFGIDVGPVETVLRKALAYRPEDRYRNSGEMLDALETAVAAAPTVPHAAPASVPSAAGWSEPVHTGPSGSNTLSGASGERLDASAVTPVPSRRGAWIALTLAVMAVCGGVGAWSVLRHGASGAASAATVHAAAQPPAHAPTAPPVVIPAVPPAPAAPAIPVVAPPPPTPVEAPAPVPPAVVAAPEPVPAPVPPAAPEPAPTHATEPAAPTAHHHAHGAPAQTPSTVVPSARRGTEYQLN